MKIHFQAWAWLATLAVPGGVLATYTAQPVKYYESSGIAIPYVPGPTAQPSSNAAAPASTPSVAPAPQSSSPVAISSSPVSTAQVDQPSASPISHTVVSDVTSALLSISSEADKQPTATLQAEQVTTAAAQVDVAGGALTIDINNYWQKPLSISYLNNAGSPSAIGAPQAAPLATKTRVVYPTGWAGRISIGSLISSANSLIEGSTTGWPDIDVSYVDGFSVPITCSVNNVAITGCNIDLWSLSPCPNSVGDQGVCLNPMQGVANGPATDWFKPCQGAAYTFPNDNIANNGNTGSPNIVCCVGSSEQGCPAPERQGHGNNLPSKAKRSVAEDLNVRAPSLMPKAHGSHLKRHVVKARAHMKDLKELV